MKKKFLFFTTLLVVLVLLFVPLIAVAAQTETPPINLPTPVLELWQIGVVALAASIITSLASWLIEKVIPWIVSWPIFKARKPLVIDLDRFVKTILLFITCGGLAFWWFPFTIPPWPLMAGLDLPAKNALFWDWVKILLPPVISYAGGAYGIYDLALGFVLDPDRRTQAIQNLINWFLARFQPKAPPTS